MSARKAKPKFVLDSYAILTYLKEEAGWQKVRDIIWDAYKRKASLFINYVNLGEIYYIIYREHGAVTADRITSMIKQWPISFVSVKESLAIIAGRVKAENKLSYADAYVVATALTKRSTVITGDQEFKPLEEIIDIHWLPKNR
ncbi:MAG: type II toxin-antitoxin system VapC family toxin [bacterium]